MKRETHGLDSLVGLMLLIAVGWNATAAAADARTKAPRAQATSAEKVYLLVGENASPAERIFLADLRDMLGRTYPGERLISDADGLPREGRAILIGTPRSFPLIARYVDVGRLERPESFVVTHAREGKCALGIIAGADVRGVGHGIYGLLDRLGWGFYLSYDAAPPENKTPLSFDAWEWSDAPLFPHRVVFDWHNFLSGCSTWNLEHWKKWIIQSQKMGYNAVMVHAYGNNPMVEFELNGQAKPVGFLSTTRSGRDWSTMHVNDVRRLWGGQVFDGPAFGSEAALVPEERRGEAVRRMMHDAFQCAKDRGVGVWFAFDIETFQANPQNVILTLPEQARFLVPSNSGPEKLWLADPDTKDGYAYYKAQVAALLKAYPQITTLVCWFRWGAGTPWMRMTLENMPPAWQAEYRAEIARTPEAARLELPQGCFALSKAVRVYARALRDLGRADVQVATGTWRFAFYPACDRFMPREVALVGLDYDVLHGHSCFEEQSQRDQQAAVGAHRIIVPIAWAHHDDGAYLGRSFTPYEHFADKLAQMKTAGYGIIHWTTRPLDLYFKSLAVQVRQSTKNQPLGETCAEMAAKTFGEAARAQGGEYLRQWITTAPLFSRETGDRFVDRELPGPTAVAAAGAPRLRILESIDRARLSKAGRDWIDYFHGLERFINDVHRNEAAYRASLSLAGKGDRDGARRELAACDPEATIDRYARFSSLQGVSRGEQGSVVSMNTRWLAHYVRLRQGLGMEPVRYKFGPTQHDLLAQSRGIHTFYFTPDRALWQTLGTEETGAKTFVLPESTTVSAPGMPADWAEIGYSGIESDKPLTLPLGPIMAQGSRGKSSPLALPAGKYRLTLLSIPPSASPVGGSVFDVRVVPHPVARRSGMEWYTFLPVKTRYVRLACRGNSQNGWNSIIEVSLDTLVEGQASVQSSAELKDYPAAAAADGKPETRWAIEGRDHWIQFEVAPDRETSRIGIWWYGGEKRRADFEILVSPDGRRWRKVEMTPSGPAPASASLCDFTGRIVLDKSAGGRLHRSTLAVVLDRPGTLELTLSPVEGPVSLCALVLEPAD